jgi:hypothetical protein
MEWLGSLKGTVVAVDTAPIIYLVERHPKYIAVVEPFFQSLERGDCTGLTSILTVLKVLVQPFRSGNTALADQDRTILLGARNLRTLDVAQDIAQEAARCAPNTT